MVRKRFSLIILKISSLAEYLLSNYFYVLSKLFVLETITVLQPGFYHQISDFPSPYPSLRLCLALSSNFQYFSFAFRLCSMLITSLIIFRLYYSSLLFTKELVTSFFNLRDLYFPLFLFRDVQFYVAVLCADLTHTTLYRASPAVFSASDASTVWLDTSDVI